MSSITRRDAGRLALAAAGLAPTALARPPIQYNMKADSTEEEMARGFEMTRTLGARAIVCSANVSVVKRIDALAKKYKVRVALHNNSRIAADELARCFEYCRDALLT